MGDELGSNLLHCCDDSAQRVLDPECQTPRRRVSVRGHLLADTVIRALCYEITRGPNTAPQNPHDAGHIELASAGYISHKPMPAA